MDNIKIPDSEIERLSSNCLALGIFVDLYYRTECRKKVKIVFQEKAVENKVDLCVYKAAFDLVKESTYFVIDCNDDYATISSIKERTRIALREFYKKQKNQFVEELRPYLGMYGRDMLNEFYTYWTEESKTGKPRFTYQTTFEIERRLETWYKNKLKR